MSEGAAYARRADPDTSHEAAISIRGKTATELEQLVLEAIDGLGGDATSEEVAKYLGIDLQSISPRFKPLETKGLIDRTDKRRPGASGKGRIVWKLHRSPQRITSPSTPPTAEIYELPFSGLSKSIRV